MRRPGSASDPLWYKDAIVYELPVRAFFDSNADGVGDLAGLTQKLDYLQDLGVTCLWLLPFFPSPLRDDGYDISDYLSIHPNYGSMEDFQAFLAEAHNRGLQVMIELVLNHTSDQHPWFQAARRAPPGSVERDYYVWSDTDQKYRDARIIFTDTEKSNWTWDAVAQAYYWHRFFAHQPDLNYDNPKVVDEMLKVIRFWLDLGADALRVDAIPYLVERDGTNCENLPETHQLIKLVRREIDAGYSSRMILAEANQWPSDVRPYFGDGDECHMAFHFPLMPRIYMALRQEDRLPITDIMAQTPEIPATCQWGLFLRNHDELTLEMVTNDERDYMYLAYSADPRMRINLGIRRRLAPLMDNNVRRIELLNSLLLSFPGTPIIYYGDEIGMGDNIYLGDRNGVRTPMQWNADRNAGFSRANPLRLYSPVIMDPVFGYEAVNVEAQQSDPSSHLSWMRNMIALRKLFRVFGRGTLEFLNPENRKVLAYLRRHGSQQVLCVANLSRFPQPVDLDLSKLEGMTPVEMLGYVEFPRISRQPYRLTLGAYGFLWLELHGALEEARMPAGEPGQAVLTVSSGFESLFEGAARYRLETVTLPGFLVKQRWFGAKSRKIQAVRVLDWVCLERRLSALALAEVTYENGPPETYCIPLAMALDKTADQLREAAPDAVLAEIVTREGAGVLYDGVLDDSCCASLLTLIEGSRELPARNGVIRGRRGAAFAGLRGDADAPLSSRRSTAEQSNSSILYGERLILKVFRSYRSGPNPDCEMGEYLTDQAHFDGIPAFAGSIEYIAENGEPATLGMLQGLLANGADGWTSTLEELERYFECCANVPFPESRANEPRGLMALSEQPPTSATLDHIGIYLEPAAALGRRTAELHLALAAPVSDPAFSPEPITAQDVQSLSAVWRDSAMEVFDALKASVSRLPDDLVEVAGRVLGRRSDLLNRLRISPDGEGNGLRIRIHGDYHLGQVLRIKTDYFIFDFEGEPARPLEERRAKHSALKDVAGMLRSFNYAAQTALMNHVERRGEDPARLQRWARLWERATAAEFLRAYRERARDASFLPSCPQRFQALLAGYWLDKAFYELLYELNNRPGWTRIPLLAIQSLPL
jgi:maltose alpha-D-glucosyltransferase / alpha-amylase